MKDLGNPTVGSVHLQLFCLSVIRVPWSYPLCVIRLDITGGGKFENMWGGKFFFFACFDRFWAFLLETVCSSYTRSFEVLMEQVLILIWPKWGGGQMTPCPPESAGLFYLLTRSNFFLVVFLKEHSILELSQTDVIIVCYFGLIKAFFPYHSHLFNRVTVWKMGKIFISFLAPLFFSWDTRPFMLRSEIEDIPMTKVI